MALENPSVIDAAGVEKSSKCVVLTIADSWDWSNEREHLIALQDKINTYFEFIESEQVWERFPDAAQRNVAIEVVSRYPLPVSAEALIERARQIAAELGASIRHRFYPSSLGGTGIYSGVP